MPYNDAEICKTTQKSENIICITYFNFLNYFFYFFIWVYFDCWLLVLTPLRRVWHSLLACKKWTAQQISVGEFRLFLLNLLSCFTLNYFILFIYLFIAWLVKPKPPNLTQSMKLQSGQFFFRPKHHHLLNEGMNFLLNIQLLLSFHTCKRNYAMVSWAHLKFFLGIGHNSFQYHFLNELLVKTCFESLISSPLPNHNWELQISGNYLHILYFCFFIIFLECYIHRCF